LVTDLGLTDRNSNGKFVELKEKGLHLLKSEMLAAIPWLRHGFSTRLGGRSIFPPGALNLGFTDSDSREAVEANRMAFFEALGMDGFSVVRLRQTHSSQIALFESTRPSPAAIEADAVVTRLPQVILTVLTADCVPLLIVDPESRTVGAVHAGWRGTAQGIAAKTVATLLRHGSGSAFQLCASMGPSIGPCCYEVGVEVLRSFQKEFTGADRYFSSLLPGRDPAHPVRGPSGPDRPVERFSLDLLAANRDQLVEAGVLPENISISASCTGCHPELLFSYRKENGHTGRMMAAIASVE
jgi:YfiH family protein